ncbi:MAG: hypothetical protein ACK5JD_15715 [Mangrovibacterium sp.]
MRYFILSLFLIISVLIANGQKKEPRFQRSDIELGLGTAFGANNYYYKHGGAGPYFRMEYRYNLKVVPLDLGFQLAVSGLKHVRDDDDSNSVDTEFLVSNYHFFKTTNVDLYAGVGLGLVNVEEYFGSSMRIGAKLFKHLNFSLEYKFLYKEDAHAVASLGFYF